MCIALLSNAHPSYRLILINNRDEYFNRPTAPASWWPSPHSHVLGGRDLLRPVQGTWLGVTKQGRIAVLTNFNDVNSPAWGLISRGAIIRAFLTDGTHHSSTTESLVSEIVGSEASRGAGGFSLICGKVGEPLTVVSNTWSSEMKLPWILGPQSPSTVGLSNATFDNRSWKKVADGEKKLADTIKYSVDCGSSENEFIEQLLELLSTDTFPRLSEDEGDLASHIAQMRNTILVPPLGHQTTNQKAKKSEMQQSDVTTSDEPLGQSGLYGTHKQTVVLVDRGNRVRFFERTLYDEAGIPIPTGQGDVDFSFDLES